MSVHVGLRSFDGKQISPVDVVSLLSGLELRGPDYEGICLSDDVGMGFRGFNVAPEDREDQPLQGANGIVVTFDGRLDNRPDLASRLGTQDAKAISDVSLVLAMFERFGENCFELLQGEFACALWDKARGALFLARSLCGTCPLFYVRNRERIAWSSELDDLVVKMAPECSVNVGYAIGFVFYQPDIEESPFENVSVVPCGSYVEVKKDNDVRVRQMWRPETIRPRMLKSDADYEEAWRAEMDATLRARMRVAGKMFCELSGGIDSSTVAVLAHRRLTGTGLAPELLTTVSCLYETSESCDERFFVSMVEGAIGRAGVHISEHEQAACLGLDDIDFTGVPNTLHCFPGRYRAIRKAMKESNSRLLLTGLGGDGLFWSDSARSPGLADFLVKGELFRLISESRQWSRVSGMPLWEVLVKQAIAPITVASRFLHWHRAEGYLSLPWVTPEARRWLTARGRNLGLRIDHEVRLPSQRARLLSIRSVRAAVSAGYFREYYGIHFSHPYTAQALVEFVLSLPISQLARPGEGRSLVRRAMVGLLPDRIVRRVSKGTVDEAFCRALIREELGEVSRFEICRQGYIEPRHLSVAIRGVRLGRLEQSAILIRLFSLERWLQSFAAIPRHRARLNLVGRTKGVQSNIACAAQLSG